MTERDRFVWHRHPEAERYVVNHLAELLAALPAVDGLRQRLVRRTDTRLVDWIDHLVLAGSDRTRGELAELGFEAAEVEAEPGDSVYHHPGATLPRFVLRQGTRSGGTALAAAVQVEDASHFLMMHHLSAPIAGSILSPYRRAVAWQDGHRALLVVERRGHGGFVPVELPPDETARYLSGFERWATRRRDFDDEREGMARTLALARSLAADLGADRAAWVAFAAERAHWQRRNRAGQVQKARQDTLGLGWANHDHHTFRSSRSVFPVLIEILETLGFHARERFYAGAQAGWGAQVMEQPACRLAVFADVDLSPDEVEGDFAHRPLPERDELGTVGLWCALHGESMLGAGLHHLAARLDFDAAIGGLADWDVATMRPFSNFSFLRQAFTRGERWEVAPGRLARLASAGKITEEQQARFVDQGAVGSHLENIQRGEGFKGFNQETISDIIRRTDPREEVGTQAA
ncbi:MAG: hypothetical protein JXA93_11460 [Anaerolineae bacterium]|nr:hypothetical protein [Anaerolineae bacterium]